MSNAALILNVITRTEPRRILAAWRTVYLAAHPESSENAALTAYAEACAELEAM
jgi:hypothetical protein